MHFERNRSESAPSGRKCCLVPVSRFDSVFAALQISDSCPSQPPPMPVSKKVSKYHAFVERINNVSNALK